MPINEIPEGMVWDASNVDIYPTGLLWPRAGFLPADTAGSPPTVGVRYLAAERDGSTEYLWAFQSDGSAAMTARRYNGTTWAAMTLSDTVATLAEPHICRYNGKVFLAYNSNVNRLHVLDIDGIIRRVGVDRPVAATVANTGAGAYAATLRYYKTQQLVYSAASVLQASSELSAEVSFTPSGAGTAARVTKPATVDSATHWRVYGSTDNVTYYLITGDIAIGTTTYDDSVTPANYSAFGGGLAPIVGLFVPPPSAKFLVTDGTRLLMAGAHETTATASQTTPSPKRVWFTRPLGVTDAGDDESITTTGEFRYWIDIDDPSDSTITALQQINGSVYVFFSESVWRLTPTGLNDFPYRSERVSATVGAASQEATCVGATSDYDEAVYFYSTRTGINRLTMSRGIEWLGSDVVPRVPPTYVQGVKLVFDKNRRDLWFVATSGVTGVRRIAVDFLFKAHGEYHGGARSLTSANLSINITCGESYAGVFYVGGGTTSDSLYYLSNNNSDDDGSAIASYIQSAIFGDNLHLYTLEEPTIQLGNVISAATVVVQYSDGFPEATSRSTTLAVTGVSQRGLFRVHGANFSDARGFRAGLSVSSGTFGRAPDARVERLTIPYTAQEAL